MKLNGKKKDWPILSNEFNEDHSMSDLNTSQNNTSLALIVPKKNGIIEKPKKNRKDSKTRKKELTKVDEEDEKSVKKKEKHFDEDKLYKKLEKSQKKLDKMVAKGRASIAEQPFVDESVVVENDPKKVIVVTHRPASRSYKIFVRSYPLDFDYWCPAMLGLTFIVLLVFFTGLLGARAGSNKEFVVPYGSL